MPTIFNSLVHDQHLTPHVAWRISFIVPGICITVVAIAMLLLCDDTPTGKWEDRHLAAQQNLANHGIQEAVVDAPTGIAAKEADSSSQSSARHSDNEKNFKAGEQTPGKFADHEAQMSEQSMVDTARGEIVVKPSFKEMMSIIFTPQVLVCGAGYFNSFGAEVS